MVFEGLSRIFHIKALTIMETIKLGIVVGALFFATAAYAQNSQTNTSHPTTPQPTTPVQVEAGQQNSETFNKTEAEKAFNPQNTPIIPGAVLQDTIVPGRSRPGANHMQKNPYRKDTTKVLGGKGTTKDTTRKSSGSMSGSKKTKIP
jgi:cell division protein YceG involved in septum cleavage